MSRKWLLVLVAVIGAIAAFLGKAFGLSPNFAPAFAGFGLIIVYLFNEAKADWIRAASQSDKWKDPKFWSTLVGEVIAALGTAGVTLLPVSPEVLTGIIAFLVGLLFKVKPT